MLRWSPVTNLVLLNKSCVDTCLLFKWGLHNYHEAYLAVNQYIINIPGPKLTPGVTPLCMLFTQSKQDLTIIFGCVPFSLMEIRLYIILVNCSYTTTMCYHIWHIHNSNKMHFVSCLQGEPNTYIHICSIIHYKSCQSATFNISLHVHGNYWMISKWISLWLFLLHFVTFCCNCKY